MNEINAITVLMCAYGVSWAIITSAISLVAGGLVLVWWSCVGAPLPREQPVAAAAAREPPTAAAAREEISGRIRHEVARKVYSCARMAVRVDLKDISEQILAEVTAMVYNGALAVRGADEATQREIRGQSLEAIKGFLDGIMEPSLHQYVIEDAFERAQGMLEAGRVAERAEQAEAAARPSSEEAAMLLWAEQPDGEASFPARKPLALSMGDYWTEAPGARRGRPLLVWALDG